MRFGRPKKLSAHQQSFARRFFGKAGTVAVAVVGRALFARLHAEWSGDAIAEWKQLLARA